jgi:hypothetical protein
MALFSMTTFCSFTHAPWMFSTVEDALEMPLLIASSKLSFDVAVISMTFATLMRLLSLASERENQPRA